MSLTIKGKNHREVDPIGTQIKGKKHREVDPIGTQIASWKTQPLSKTTMLLIKNSNILMMSVSVNVFNQLGFGPT